LARVAEVVYETPRCRSIVLDPPAWPGHLAGQHVDVRLTAEDGYQAQRSYSIASSPEDRKLVLTVERIDDGEVSPYLVDELRPGDELELRGPIGGYFVWERSLGGPLLLIAGGSGIVPFRASCATTPPATATPRSGSFIPPGRWTTCCTSRSSSPSCPTTALPRAWPSRAHGPKTGTDIAGA
jgi:ferredoxin-NADP reductase